jgi:hypothetical protein
MMRRFFRNIIIALSVLGFTSCIENDLSYPDVTAEFTGFTVEGQKSVTIDKEARTISIVMGETADLADVKVISYTLSAKTEVVGGVPETLDLTKPVTMTIRLYADYEWTITATQPIERYIRCENQVGEAEIDHVRKMAYVYVSEEQSLVDVVFNEMKLEPEGSSVKSTVGFISENGQSIPKAEDCSFPMTLDCVVMRYFYVEYQGQEIEWSVKVLQKAVEVAMTTANGWTFSAGFTGAVNGKGVPVFEYRRADAQDWIQYDDVLIKGSSVSAEVRGLQPDTDYVVRLSNGTDISKEMAFRTGKDAQLGNLSFDGWSKSDKYPNPEGMDIWDSANSSGAAVTTSPSTDAVKSYAARLESVNAFGMLAAGNIFTGKFVGLAGLGAKLDWGVPFDSRPLALRGHYKYAPVAIDKAKDPYTSMLGKPDQCQILIFLTDWDGPFRVNTNEKKFVDLDNDPGIIALGQLNSSEASSKYIDFTLPIVYRDGSRIPKYIVIAAASSRYGDYFTGGRGSVLHIDEFEFVYDPDELTDEEYEAVFHNVRPY